MSDTTTTTVTPVSKTSADTPRELLEIIAKGIIKLDKDAKKRNLSETKDLIESIEIKIDANVKAEAATTAERDQDTLYVADSLKAVSDKFAIGSQHALTATEEVWEIIMQGKLIPLPHDTVMKASEINLFLIKEAHVHHLYYARCKRPNGMYKWLYFTVFYIHAGPSKIYYEKSLIDYPSKEDGTEDIQVDIGVIDQFFLRLTNTEQPCSDTCDCAMQMTRSRIILLQNEQGGLDGKNQEITMPMVPPAFFSKYIDPATSTYKAFRTRDDPSPPAQHIAIKGKVFGERGISNMFAEARGCFTHEKDVWFIAKTFWYHLSARRQRMPRHAENVANARILLVCRRDVDISQCWCCICGVPCKEPCATCVMTELGLSPYSRLASEAEYKDKMIKENKDKLKCASVLGYCGCTIHTHCLEAFRVWKQALPPCTQCKERDLTDQKLSCPCDDVEWRNTGPEMNEKTIVSRYAFFTVDYNQDTQAIGEYIIAPLQKRAAEAIFNTYAVRNTRETKTRGNAYTSSTAVDQRRWIDIIGYNNMEENIHNGAKNVYPIVSNQYYQENILGMEIAPEELSTCTKYLHKDQSPFFYTSAGKDGKTMKIHRYNISTELHEPELYRGAFTLDMDDNGSGPVNTTSPVVDDHSLLHTQLPDFFASEHKNLDQGRIDDPPGSLTSNRKSIVQHRIDLARKRWLKLHDAREQRVRLLMKNVHHPPSPPPPLSPLSSALPLPVKEPSSPLTRALDDAHAKVKQNKTALATTETRDGNGKNSSVSMVVNVSMVGDYEDDVTLPALETDDENSSDDEEDDAVVTEPRRKKPKSGVSLERQQEILEQLKTLNDAELAEKQQELTRKMAEIKTAQAASMKQASTLSTADGSEDANDKSKTASSTDKTDAKVRLRVADIINDITAKSADINDDIFANIKAEAIVLINAAIHGTTFKTNGVLRMLEFARQYATEVKSLGKQISVLGHKAKVAEEQLQQTSTKLSQSEERVDLKQQTIDAQKKQVAEAKAARVQADTDRATAELKNKALVKDIQTRDDVILQEQDKQQVLLDRIDVLTSKVRDLEKSEQGLTNIITKNKERFQEMRALRDAYKLEVEAKQQSMQDAFDQEFRELQTAHEKHVDKLTADARNELANVRQQCKCKEFQEKNTSLALELAKVHKNAKASLEKEQKALYSVMGLEIECRALQEQERANTKLIEESKTCIRQFKETNTALELLRQEHKKLLADPQVLKHHLVTEGDLGDMEWRHRSAIDHITKERVRREVNKRTKESKKCAKCNFRQINCVIVPCGHGICDVCYSSIKDCHVCNVHAIMSVPKYGDLVT